MRLAGFYTQELRRENERVGFEVVGLHGTHCVLAHVDFSSEHRVGRYSVELGGLESIVQEELGKAEDTVDVIVIDEIGRMECLSRVFIEAVTRALNGPNPVLATVANAGGGFIDWVRNLRNARLVSVSQNNRDDLPTRVSGWLLASR
jgi:nucleoside-triphosphatase